MTRLAKKLLIAAIGVSLVAPALVYAQAKTPGGERKDNFKIHSRISEIHRNTTREILALQPWHQYQSIVFGVFFGTSDVKILGPETIECPRCNGNPVAEAIPKLKQSCESAGSVHEEARIPTASQSKDPKTGEPVLKQTFWLKSVYRCESNPFAQGNAFHQENRLTVTKASPGPIAQFISQRCGFYSDSRGFRVDIGGNVISYPWVSATSHVSTKEFVDLPHPDDFWFRPMGKAVSGAMAMNDLLLSSDQLVVALPMPVSNAVPESVEYARIGTPGGGFIHVQFEQNAVVSLNSYLPQSDSYFSCDAVVGANGFTGKMQFNRTE